MLIISLNELSLHSDGTIKKMAATWKRGCNIRNFYQQVLANGLVVNFNLPSTIEEN
jgi:hypothetical protein